MSPRTTSVVLGAGLCVALSPGLYDALAHWVANPWSRYSAAFVPLLVWAVLQERDPVSHPRLGVAAIAVGLVLQLLAALAVMPALGRPGFAIAAIGFLLFRGLASPRCAALALFIVPVPHSVLDALGGDAFAFAWLRAGAEVLGVFDWSVVVGQHEVLGGGTALSVDSSQAGVPVLVAAVGLAWWAGVRTSAPIRRVAAWLAAALATGAAAHFMAVLLACATLASGHADASVFLLDSFGWLATVVVVALAVERQ